MKDDGTHAGTVNLAVFEGSGRGAIGYIWAREVVIWKRGWGAFTLLLLESCSFYGLYWWWGELVDAGREK